jgi:hypothetical protein
MNWRRDDLEDDDFDGTLIPALSVIRCQAQLRSRGFKRFKLCFVSPLHSPCAVVFVSSCFLVGTLYSAP